MNLDLDDAAETPSNSLPVNIQLGDTPVKVILAHENPELIESTKQLLKKVGWSVQLHRASSIEDLAESITQAEWDIIIAYSNSTVFQPAVITKQMEKSDIALRAIYIDDTFSATNAAQIIHCGFSDYLTGEEDQRLLYSIAKEVNALRDRRVAFASEASLAKAQAKSDLLLESTTDAIAYIADGMIIHANSTFAELLGYSNAEDLELLPIMDMVIADHQSQIRKIIKNLDCNEATASTELKFLTAEQNELSASLEFASATHDGEPCTQIIIKPTGQTVANDAVPSEASASQPVSTTSATAAPVTSSLTDIQHLTGKGLIGFISLANPAVLRKSVNYQEHITWINDISRILDESAPENIIFRHYMAENWVIAAPENTNLDLQATEKHISEKIHSHTASTTNIKDELAIACGFTQYGIAGISADMAIDKAFKLCTELGSSGGSKVFAPKIDNAEGSAALRSAMELDRLLVKYQPIIGLHNQTAQHYEACIFLRNDSGQEQSADSFIESLGLEKENVALDQWVVEQTITTLATVVYDNADIHLAIPLTASALADEDFADWAVNKVSSCGLPKENISFNISCEHAKNYTQQVQTLITQLKKSGFQTSISNIGQEDVTLITSVSPNFAYLDKWFTENLNAEEDQNSRESLKTLVQQTATTSTICIATAVNTAAELAQLWQTGIPYVQGNYLQAPLSEMNYEFSDIA